jgi:hypothetical protein
VKRIKTGTFEKQTKDSGPAKILSYEPGGGGSSGSKEPKKAAEVPRSEQVKEELSDLKRFSFFHRFFF